MRRTLFAFVTVALALLVVIAAQPAIAQTNAGKAEVKLALAADIPALTVPQLTLKQAAPAPAPTTPSKWSAIAVAAPNTEVPFGLGAQYQAIPDLAFCAFGKADPNTKLDLCVGATTSLSTIGNWFVKQLFGVTVTSTPSSWQIGGAYAIRAKQGMAIATKTFNTHLSTNF